MITGYVGKGGKKIVTDSAYNLRIYRVMEKKSYLQVMEMCVKMCIKKL